MVENREYIYVYITMVVSLDRSFVLNSCNSQYSQVSIVLAIPRLQSSSKELLFDLCLYLVLLKVQSLHIDVNREGLVELRSTQRSHYLSLWKRFRLERITTKKWSVKTKSLVSIEMNDEMKKNREERIRRHNVMKWYVMNESHIWLSFVTWSR